MKRMDSIDVLRTMAIVFMVLCHFGIILAPAEGEYPGVYFFSNHVVGDFAAPLFLLLSGMSQAISLRRQGGEGRIFDATGVRMLKRGVGILGIGLVFAAMAHGVRSTFDWDILPLIGFSMLVFCVVRRWPTALIAFLIVVLFAAAPWLRSVSGYARLWGEPSPLFGLPWGLSPGLIMDPAEEYAVVFTPGSILLGFLVNGYFPVFPWLAFPLVGFVLGKAVFREGRAGAGGLEDGIGLAGTGLVAQGILIGWYGRTLGAGAVLSGWLAPFSFYPDTPAMFLLQMGLCLVAFWLCRAYFDSRERSGWLVDYCRLTSRFSFSIYVLHHFLLLWSLALAGWLRGESAHAFYQKAMPSPLALGLAVVALFGFQLLFRLWDRQGGRYSLEWLVERMAPKKG